MHEIKELETALEFIENEQNYYAGFKWVIETCARADVVNTALWNVSKISDEQKLFNSERIRCAKGKAVNKHREWAIRRLKESESKHTVESIVSSVYNAIFD